MMIVLVNVWSLADPVIASVCLMVEQVGNVKEKPAARGTLVINASMASGMRGHIGGAALLTT